MTFVGLRPSSVDTVLEVNNSYSASVRHCPFSFRIKHKSREYAHDNRTAVSCSCSRMLRRASRKPVDSSACVEHPSIFPTRSRRGEKAIVTDLFEIELCLPADIRIRVEHGLNAGPEPGSVHDVVLVLLPAQAMGRGLGGSWMAGTRKRRFLAGKAFEMPVNRRETRSQAKPKWDDPPKLVCLRLRPGSPHLPSRSRSR